jgi:alkaline phosphatase
MPFQIGIAFFYNLPPTTHRHIPQQEKKYRILNHMQAIKTALLISTFLASFFLTSCLEGTARSARTPEPLFIGARPPDISGAMERPRAIIVMIADGGGFNQIKAETYFIHGKYPDETWSRFAISLAASTYPEGGSYDPAAAWTDFTYPPRNPTDSAAAATALATGHKTANGMIAMASTGEILETVLERAESRGMLTGIVTTVPISHATPAAFAAHADSRGEYARIARDMILNSGLDVLMGCGNPEYDNAGAQRQTPDYEWIPESVWNALENRTAANDRDADGIPDAWTLIHDASDFRALIAASAFAHVVGIPEVADTLQERRGGNAEADAFSEPFTTTVPRLDEMTLGALNLLSKGQNGFVLVVEGGAIDWANHAHQSGRMIEEYAGFEGTVHAVIDWVAADPARADTLVIVTADHESGYLMGPDSGAAAFNAIENRGAGAMPGMEWFSAGHTNSLVPFFAMGKNAVYFANDISGFDSRRGWYIDNAAIGKRLLDMLK